MKEARRVFILGILIFCWILKSEDDPFERVNRFIYGLNTIVDQSFSRPLAKAYRKMPENLRKPISNFFENLVFPSRFLSLLLSGRVESAFIEIQRFFFDTTVGLGGFLKPSMDISLELIDHDFDLTLKDWGIDTGPYLMLPLLGPSSLRAVIPSMVGMSINAWTNLLIDDKGLKAGFNSLSALNARAELEPLFENAERMSFDTYIFIRNFYLAKRSLRGGLNEDSEDAF